MSPETGEVSIPREAGWSYLGVAGDAGEFGVPPASTMIESDEALDIRDPGLTDVLGDDDALSLWEMIRRAGRPTDAGGLCEASGLAIDRVHDRLDRLVEAGLLEPVRATRRHPTIRYRVRRETIIVGYRVGDPLDEILITCVDDLFGSERRRRIESLIRRGTARQGPHERWNRVWAGDLNREEIRRFWDLMQEVARLYHAGTARFVGSTPSPEQMCTHHLEFVAEPLRSGVRPLPEIRMVARDADGARAAWVLGAAPSNDRRAASAGRSTLTAREREVAGLLAAGHARGEVATRLGISLHTVISHTRNLYRKLGVRSRVELRERLA